MLTIENTEVVGLEPAIRGMRNPLNSWNKSDSAWVYDDPEESWRYKVGDNDLGLMKRLAANGPVHAKYRRMINVYADIIAPAYWVSELDTYKVGTVRNSCSMQHKGATRDYTIRDFSVLQKELYEILDPETIKREHPIVYPYETDEYRKYHIGDRTYRVYRNGKIISEEFTITNSMGITKTFKERELKPTQDSAGYCHLNLGGRFSCEKWMVHRLVAHVWIDNPDGKTEVNHKDMNKGNNSVENLEWVTHQENEVHKHQNGGSGRTLHTDYLNYKASKKFSLRTRYAIREEYKSGVSSVALGKKYGLSQAQAYAIATEKDERTELFEFAEFWEKLLEGINKSRKLYLETGDYKYFLQMRAIMPMGYNYKFTWMANYEVLNNIYNSRKDHKLPEWHTFCHWIEGLPYSEIITGIGEGA